MDTCFRRHESLVYSASRLVPEKFLGPRGVGSLGALGEWLPRSRSKGVGFLGAVGIAFLVAVGIGSRGDGAGEASAGGQFTTYPSLHVHISLPAKHARSGPPHPCSLSRCPLRHVPGWHQAHLSRSERQHHKRLMSVALMSMQRSWILGAPLHPVPHWASQQHSHLGKGHILPRNGLHYSWPPVAHH